MSNSPVPPSRSLSRRSFLGIGAAVFAQDSLAGRGSAGTLRDPSVVGRPRTPTLPGENEAEIQAIETRLACNCGCTLDVFTCRTTDFSCTYSPKLHREVLALKAKGLTAQQVLDAFVAEYGEKALMAPKASGFNLWGYLLPGAVILAAGAGLVAVIARRKAAVAGATTAGAAAMPGEGGAAPATNASAEELERLRQALSEVED
ncbi:MAG TPA: cytochrome c-type biogenesis protein CcmH [Gemmatimonadales bacterium]|jgi:cytochrome c-type biogenesis protein CcmH